MGMQREVGYKNLTEMEMGYESPQGGGWTGKAGKAGEGMAMAITSLTSLTHPSPTLWARDGMVQTQLGALHSPGTPGAPLPEGSTRLRGPTASFGQSSTLAERRKGT